jgi:hypothetical protein
LNLSSQKLEDIAHRLVTDLVTQLSQSASNAVVAPGRILLGYLDDSLFDILSLGVSGDGGIPLRMGIHDGNRSDTVDLPHAIEQSAALGLDGLRSLVADSKAYTPRILGLCRETGMGLVTLVPHTCAIRQEMERLCRGLD